ncbi:hypothetical protein [Nonomuraea zeae]|uniref:DUF4367 domain-containing protein n=1 Tax=Nonomuraea zeae TaxID=1642303 RepID=A0A5S4GVH2_9ACTN|nr:hypothetical protein [Nonomuraea zeae]TMR36444.1 hypothetical protein ETD85_10660 [Nonomuraea zeae]
MSSGEPFDDLEAELLALGDLLDVPAPPPADVAAAVRARLEAAPAPGGDAAPVRDGDAAPAPGGDAAPARDGGRRPARRARPARWKVVTAVLIAVVAITAATPQGRAAVVHILRFAGIEIQIGDTPPTPIPTTALMPGEQAVLPADLADHVKFPIKSPAALGDPQSATVADGGRVASMFWAGGIRLDQFDGGLDPIFFKKLGPPWPDYVQIGPYQGWWISGAHPLGYIRREDGTEVPLRQAAPTLIWQQGTMSYRLEGVGSAQEAVRIATSLK